MKILEIIKIDEVHNRFKNYNDPVWALKYILQRS